MLFCWINNNLSCVCKYRCFLNSENNFIYAFIIPTVFIFIANICFFIMAASISWKRHNRKRVMEKNNKAVLGWLKSIIPLVVVLGLTWILGLLIVEVDVLVPIAYIYTIMVAFQGLFIFVVLVLFSKAERDDYLRWWTTKVFKKVSLQI